MEMQGFPLYVALTRGTGFVGVVVGWDRGGPIAILLGAAEAVAHMVAKTEIIGFYMNQDEADEAVRGWWVQQHS